MNRIFIFIVSIFVIITNSSTLYGQLNCRDKSIVELLTDIKTYISNVEMDKAEVRFENVGKIKIKYVFFVNDSIGKFNVFDRFSNEKGENFPHYSSSFSVVENERIVKFKGFYYENELSEIVITDLNHKPTYSFAINNSGQIQTVSLYKLDGENIIEMIFYPSATSIDVRALTVSQIKLDFISLNDTPRYSVSLPLEEAIIRIGCRE